MWCKLVNCFPLPLVSPLGSEHDGRWHRIHGLCEWCINALVRLWWSFVCLCVGFQSALRAGKTRVFHWEWIMKGRQVGGLAWQVDSLRPRLAS
jgi:hypothetical protein